MDVLDILTDLDHVFPFFQPIFSADEHRVIGYEIFGRYSGKQETTSLGPFFLDTQIPEEYRLEVDLTVIKKALDIAVDLEDDVMLFINCDADILMNDQGEQLLQLLLQYPEKGISLDRIVLEISEQNYTGEFTFLDHLINYYRTYGFKIAIDKIANDSNNLDRIGQIEPDIIKVDLQVLRSTATSRSFQDILYTLALLARKIGATLLFEKIEMKFQLQFAWKNGGRYYQGFYLGKPANRFINRDVLKERLRHEFHAFIVNEKKNLESLYILTETFQVKIQGILTKYRKITDYVELLKFMTKHMDHIAFRMYICDEDGFQKTPNFFFKDNVWEAQKEYLNKNWSWRPYFLENIIKMRKEKKGILSDLYSDIETGATIRTFSYPLNTNDYLFLDLSYQYLDQNM